jgi:SPX domain protein involved in polyphosphate accumulation
MEVLKTFRHEFKYVVPYGDSLKLRTKLDDLLELDRGGPYVVRSLYFDSVDDDDYYDKQGGEINRKKIRLRIYDSSGTVCKLECKAKYDVHQLKSSLLITRSQAEEIIKGNYNFLLDLDSDVAKEIYLIMMNGHYMPKVIIEYDRCAYIPNGTSTRITFDYNIKESHDFDKFFTDDINYVDCTDIKDIVLEVKFDRFLEPYIGNLLDGYAGRYQSVSKYVMGRNE